MNGINMLSRHPSNPDRPYVPWVRKVKAQLDALKTIPDPDIRTRAEIKMLEDRLGWNRNYKRSK